MKTILFKKSWVLWLALAPMIALPSYTTASVVPETAQVAQLDTAMSEATIGVKQLWQEFKTLWLKAPKIVRYGVYATAAAIVVAPALAVYTLRSPAVQKAYAEVVADMVKLAKEQRPEIVADAVKQARETIKQDGPALLKETVYKTMHLIADDVKNVCKKGLAVGLWYYRQSDGDSIFGDSQWPAVPI